MFVRTCRASASDWRTRAVTLLCTHTHWHSHTHRIFKKQHSHTVNTQRQVSFQPQSKPLFNFFYFFPSSLLCSCSTCHFSQSSQRSNLPGKPLAQQSCWFTLCLFVCLFVHCSSYSMCDANYLSSPGFYLDTPTLRPLSASDTTTVRVCCCIYMNNNVCPTVLMSGSERLCQCVCERVRLQTLVSL